MANIYYKSRLKNANESIVQAQGTPDPEILWFKGEAPVTQSNTVAVINDGTELRINDIR